MKAGSWVPWGTLGVALAWAGCSATEVEFEDDEGGPSEVTSSTSGAGGAGQGGSATGGDGGREDGPCGEDCSAIATPDCFVSVCNTGNNPGPIGSCVVVPDTDGTACDDGQFCTVDDTCQAGVCTGGPPNDCGMTAPECNVITCDETTQSCGTAPAANGEACTPADLCEIGGTCTNGVCGGVPQDCFFAPVPNECFNAVCNPQNGMCEPVAGNDGDACIDQNDLCSDGNTCSAGVCGGGSPKDCSFLTNGCDLGTCDPASGVCGAVAVMDGQMCDDLDACTIGELCTMGTCGGGTLVTACSGANTDGCCPSSCQGDNTGAADYDLDCACSVEDILIEEASTGAPDFVSVRNTCNIPIDIDPITICIDEGSQVDCEDLPSFVLQPNDVLYLVELNGALPPAPALAINLTNSQGYIFTNRGAVWLCDGTCSQASAPNAFDAVIWEGTSGSASLPPGINFNPGPVMGRDSTNEAVLRQNTAGSFPNFLQSDYVAAPPSL
ncbi:MAG: hypothetical protein AAGN82_14005 [Myxococcota bacterium]